jgi:hypothetical protein
MKGKKKHQSPAVMFIDENQSIAEGGNEKV